MLSVLNVEWVENGLFWIWVLGWRLLFGTRFRICYGLMWMDLYIKQDGVDCWLWWALFSWYSHWGQKLAPLCSISHSASWYSEWHTSTLSRTTVPRLLELVRYESLLQRIQTTVPHYNYHVTTYYVVTDYNAFKSNNDPSEVELIIKGAGI